MMCKPTTPNRFYCGLLTVLALLFVLPTLAAPRPDTPEFSTAKPEPRTFAVSGFPVIGARATEYSWLGVGLGDDLATRLARCDQHLFQVERLQFNEVLRAQRVEMLTQGVSEDAEPDAAERERLMGLVQAARTSFQGQKWGARYVIVGSLWLEGSYPQEQARLKANVRLVEVATGQIISGAQADSEGSEAGYVRLQEHLAEQLAEQLGVPAEQRVQVRDYRREGGEVYRRFAQAREALYQGRYQEAIILSEQAEAAGAHQLLPQIWETNRQAHERLVKGVLEKDKAYQLNRERRQQVEARKREVQELGALTHFEDGEQYRIEAETFERFWDSATAKEGYQQALTAYDEYLRNTQRGSQEASDTVDLEPGQARTLYPYPAFLTAKLTTLLTDQPTAWTLHITRPDGAQVFEKTLPLQLLARDTLLFQHAFLDEQVDLLSTIVAWVAPQASTIGKLLGEAAPRIPFGGFVGYQETRFIAGDRDPAQRQAAEQPDHAAITRRQVQAFYETLQDHGLRYAEQSSLYPTEHRQRVLHPQDALVHKTANCLDGTVLFASLLLRVGLQPVIVLVPGHAFLGWRTWPDNQEYEFLETTKLGTANFADALVAGQEQAKRAGIRARTLNQPFREGRLAVGNTFILDVAQLKQHLADIPLVTPEPL